MKNKTNKKFKLTWNKDDNDMNVKIGLNKKIGNVKTLEYNFDNIITNNARLEQLTLLHEIRCHILGLDIEDKENEKTPLRCAKADLEQFKKPELNFTIFDNKQYDQLIVKPFIPFSSMCSHHLYNYFGVCHLGYLPDTKICGLSKLTRLVEYISKGAHSQEWLTQKIASYLDVHLKPKGVIAVLRARHTCESCRGVKNDNEDSVFITCAVTGCFKSNDSGIKEEFFNLIKV